MSHLASNGVAWRPLHSWTNAQCECLATYWGSRLAEFVTLWPTITAADVDVRVMPLSSRDVSTGEDSPEALREVLALTSAQSVGADAWLVGQTVSGARTPVRAMASALFGDRPGPTAPASTGVACDALDALIHCFGFTRFSPLNVLPQTALYTPWAGALRLTFTLGASRWTAMAAASAVLRWLAAAGADAVTPEFDTRARGQLVSLREALAHSRVSLRVRLDGPQLALGALTDLREGDVVTLPHALSTPLHVETMTGELVCRAHLGQHGERLAIELADAHEQLSLQESV